MKLASEHGLVWLIYKLAYERKEKKRKPSFESLMGEPKGLALYVPMESDPFILTYYGVIQNLISPPCLVIATSHFLLMSKRGHLSTLIFNAFLIYPIFGYINILNVIIAS